MPNEGAGGGNPKERWEQVMVRNIAEIPGTRDLIYHELQLKGLCGLHALNNLMQGPEWSEEDMQIFRAEIENFSKPKHGNADG